MWRKSKPYRSSERDRGWRAMPTKPPDAKPNPADPLANPPAAPDVERSELPVPLPNDPPNESNGAPSPTGFPNQPDHPLGPPEPIERSLSQSGIGTPTCSVEPSGARQAKKGCGGPRVPLLSTVLRAAPRSASDSVSPNISARTVRYSDVSSRNRRSTSP